MPALLCGGNLFLGSPLTQDAHTRCSSGARTARRSNVPDTPHVHVHVIFLVLRVAPLPPLGRHARRASRSTPRRYPPQAAAHACAAVAEAGPVGAVDSKGAPRREAPRSRTGGGVAVASRVRRGLTGATVPVRRGLRSRSRSLVAAAAVLVHRLCQPLVRADLCQSVVRRCAGVVHLLTSAHTAR